MIKRRLATTTCVHFPIPREFPTTHRTDELSAVGLRVGCGARRAHTSTGVDHPEPHRACAARPTPTGTGRRRTMRVCIDHGLDALRTSEPTSQPGRWIEWRRRATSRARGAFGNMDRGDWNRTNGRCHSSSYVEEQAETTAPGQTRSRYLRCRGAPRLPGGPVLVRSRLTAGADPGSPHPLPGVGCAAP